MPDFPTPEKITFPLHFNIEFTILSKFLFKDFFNSKPNSAYFYSNGWQLKSIYALFIGFIFAASTIWNVNLNFLQSFSWIIGGLISLIIYYLLSD